MLRRTLFRRADFFSTMVPKAMVTTPHVLTAEEFSNIEAELEKKKDALADLDLMTPFKALTDVDSIQKRKKTIDQFAAIGDRLRSRLYQKDCVDPFERLVIHELIMVSGFYQRGLNANELQGESVRFVLNHYGFDIRRDTLITKKIHESLLAEKTTTTESEALLKYLLLLERHLSGKYRFTPVSGRRWFTLGLALSEIASEKEMKRVLELPVVKEYGNFSTTLDETDPLWKTYTIKCNDETFTSFVESAKLTASIRPADIVYELRIQKPPRELTPWEKRKEKMLRAFVIVFTIWVSFWIVDEEIITLLALIFLKRQQTKIMEREAEKTGGKVYIASSTGTSFR